MIQLDAASLPYPQIQYSHPGNRNDVNPNSARWNLVRTRFLRGSNKDFRWKLLVAPFVNPKKRLTTAQDFITAFNTGVTATGVCSNSTHQDNPILLRDLEETTLLNALKSILDDKSNRVPDIVVLLLNQKDQDAYSKFKYLADKVVVLQSICATATNFLKQKDPSQYMANVAMKANLKMAGVNHSTDGISHYLRNTLVLGADVTHPGNGALHGTPSIAAVVGSYEDNGGRFIGRMRLQEAKQEVSVHHFLATVHPLTVPDHRRFDGHGSRDSRGLEATKRKMA
jgi:eukaryotic translation initiation factor 2C